MIHPKVANATVAGTIIAMVCWGLSTFAHVSIPADVATAATTIAVYLAGFFTPSPPAAPAGTK